MPGFHEQQRNGGNQALDTRNYVNGVSELDAYSALVATLPQHKFLATPM